MLNPVPGTFDQRLAICPVLLGSRLKLLHFTQALLGLKEAELTVVESIKLSEGAAAGPAPHQVSISQRVVA